MDVKFDGKRALVTGAGRGIGRGIAIALYNGGAKTVALSRMQAELDSLEEECPGIETVLYDISTDWNKTEEIVQSLGHIDLLVNNAAVSIPGPAIDVTEEAWDAIFNTNAKALFRISQVVTKGMVKQGKGGSIVNISSFVSRRHYGVTVYSAAKCAVDSITRSFTNEFGKHQIRVNAVGPGMTKTKMLEEYLEKNPGALDSFINRVPQKACCEVEDVVHLVLYLLSDKSSMINGAYIPVDGGYMTT